MFMNGAEIVRFGGGKSVSQLDRVTSSGNNCANQEERCDTVLIPDSRATMAVNFESRYLWLIPACYFRTWSDASSRSRSFWL